MGGDGDDGGGDELLRLFLGQSTCCTLYTSRCGRYRHVTVYAVLLSLGILAGLPENIK